MQRFPALLPVLSPAVRGLCCALAAAGGLAMGTNPAGAQEEAPAKPARVWIFGGTPGDEEHHEAMEKLLGRLRATFTKRFAIPRAHLKVFYGPEAAGYHGPSTKENLARELGEIVTLSQDESEGPFWVVLVGHSNLVPGGSKFNLPKQDISAGDFGRHLENLRPGTPFVLWATTTASYPFLRSTSAPGRVVVSATNRKDIENETFFPQAFANALESPGSDADRDGNLSVTELFLATKAGVLKIYESEDLIVKEHAVLDGDGDGYGTMRPARKDASGAAQIALPIGGPLAGFD